VLSSILQSNEEEVETTTTIAIAIMQRRVE